MAIQIRRGNIQDFDSSKLLPGEWAVSLDNKQVFVAFAPGDTKRMATYEDMITDIQDATQEIIDNLTTGVDEAINNTNVAIETINQTNSDIQAAEEVREQQEQERQTNTETAIQNTNEATDRAIAAAEAAEGIVAGTGMVLKTDIGVPGGVAAFDDVYGKTEIDDKFTDVQGEIEGINQQMNISETTLSQDYKSIFNAGTGKDNTGAEQDFNSIVEGQSNVKLEGFTANNLIVNGDFSNGTNNVATINVENISASNNTLTFSAKSKNASIGFLQKVIINHKYYMRADIKTNSSLVGLMLSGFRNKFHSGSGKYEVVSDIIDVNENYDSRVAVRDTRDSGYDNINVRNVALFDLTQLGLDSLTKEQCDYMFDHYIDGMQGVGSHYIVSTGVNLFDTYKNPNGQGGNTTVEKLENGIKLTNGTAVNSANVNYRIKLEPNTQYTIKANSTTSGVGGGGIVVYDDYISKDLGWNYTTLNPSFTFTTPSDGIVRIYFYCTASTPEINTVTFTNIQLYKGSSNISYEPFKGSALYVALQNMQLHRLPNGITDTIEKFDGRYYLVKRTKEYILKDTDITTLNNTALTEVDITIFGWELLDGIINPRVSDGVATKMITSVSSPRNESNITPWMHYFNASNWVITFPKGLYADVNAVKAALTGTKIIYQVAQPIMYSNGKDGFVCTGNLEVFPNGTIYQSQSNAKQTTNAKTYITYNLSDKSLIISNSREITGIQKFLIGKTLIESGTNSNGRYMKFDDGTAICYDSMSANANTNKINVTLPITLLKNYYNIFFTNTFHNSANCMWSTSLREATYFDAYPRINTTEPQVSVAGHWFVIGKWI